MPDIFEGGSGLVNNITITLQVKIVLHITFHIWKENVSHDKTKIYIYPILI